MKKRLFQFLLVLFLLLLQISAIAVFSNAYIWFPQLLLLYVIGYALNRSLTETIWVSFGLGLLSEIFSTFFFGSATFAFLLTGFLVYIVTRKLTSNEVSFTTLLFLAVPATLLFPTWSFLYNAVLALAQIADSVSLRDFFAVTILWTALSNLIFLYPINQLFELIDKNK